jgi:hypothetical protein
MEILTKEGGVIETPASFIQGIFGIGGEIQGVLKVVDIQEVMAKENLSEYAGKILHAIFWD